MQLENPINEEVALKVSCDNPINFAVRPNPVILPPFGVYAAIASIVIARSGG